MSRVVASAVDGKDFTHGTGGGLLVASLARHLESDAIGSGVLELKGGGREVIEILVEELDRVGGARSPESASGFEITTLVVEHSVPSLLVVDNRPSLGMLGASRGRIFPPFQHSGRHTSLAGLEMSE